MKQEKIVIENGDDQTQQNIWGAETGITNKQLTYWNFDEYSFEEKISIILRKGGIVSTLREGDYVVLLCLYNGFYTEMYADKVSYEVLYMQPASPFTLMKFMKKDLEKSNTQFLG